MGKYAFSFTCYKHFWGSESPLWWCEGISWGGKGFWCVCCIWIFKEESIISCIAITCSLTFLIFNHIVGFTLILLAIINVIRLSNTKPFKQKESNNVNVVGPWHLLHFVQKHVVLIAEMAFFTTQNIFENMLYVYGLGLFFWPWPQTLCAWQWVQLCADQKLFWRTIFLAHFAIACLIHSIQKIVFLCYYHHHVGYFT